MHGLQGPSGTGLSMTISIPGEILTDKDRIENMKKILTEVSSLKQIIILKEDW